MGSLQCVGGSLRIVSDKVSAERRPVGCRDEHGIQHRVRRCAQIIR